MPTPAPLPPAQSEREKMIAGMPYDPSDPQLIAERQRCRALCRQINALEEGRDGDRQRLICDLLGTPSDVWIQTPFYCDYGTNISLGEKVCFNFNCVILDVGPVTIGHHTLIGPAVQIYTVLHPLDARERRTGAECSKPVTIGSDVWIGGAAVICPGVTIGDGTVIGAGSVVTRPIPAGVFAAGNPCVVIKPIGG